MHFPFVGTTVAFGVLVVVPLGLSLNNSYRYRIAIAICGALIIVSLQLHEGLMASLFVVPWFLLCTWMAESRSFVWLRNGRAVDEVLEPLSLVFLAVASVFTLFYRAGFVPPRISRPIVPLTAAHFTFAGFATAVLAQQIRLRLRTHPGKIRIVTVLSIAGPPVVAVGFMTHLAVFQIGGAVIMTGAVWSIAALTSYYVAPRIEDKVTRALFIVSVLSILISMAPAIIWTIAQYEPINSWSIDTIARTHGAANAYGFSLCGLIAWRKLGIVA